MKMTPLVELNVPQRSVRVGGGQRTVYAMQEMQPASTPMSAGNSPFCFNTTPPLISNPSIQLPQSNKLLVTKRLCAAKPR